ncbi:cadmium-transporting ATPase [Stenotrophomonas maltophilia]|nr:ATPase [Stenotrophomonas maltophilia MF89]OHY71885.1 cadmium-transporting ATPase [Stenotrophomonas maltophilia]
MFALGCGLLLVTGFIIERSAAFGIVWLPKSMYMLAYVFGGWFTLREAIENLQQKRFEIDTLMLVAAAGAATLGAWAEGALLLFLFSLGHSLENYAMGRAKRAIEALAKLAPETALVVKEGGPVEVPVTALEPGDVVLVRANDRLPADGFVIKGTSNVNQAPVTGESIPVDKHAVADAEVARRSPDAVDIASRVFAGTINGSGALEVEVSRRSTESALARVVKMVSEAETRKSPTQRLTDRFERIFVPCVLALAGVLLFSWVVIDEPFRDSFYRSMAVLVAASPCALAIATPSAVLAGIARAARSGVLIKGGAPLEELGMVTAIAFDKTGTLTAGKPRVTDVVTAEGVSEQELLEVAVAVEALSDHPLAGAIVVDGKARLSGQVTLMASGFENLAGRGVRAEVGGRPAWIGKAEMFGADGVPLLGAAAKEGIEALRSRGRTTMAVRLGDRDLGIIGLMDTPRAEAREALQKLRGLGVSRMIMISGDHQLVAQSVGSDVGVDEAWGNLMPDDKVSAIREIKASQRIAMVGDGVNDAPAMASANVGIAMGAASSDVALETADVALMSEDLRQVAFSVALSRRTKRVIRQNLYVSLGVVALLVPATVMGLGIGPAVAVHEGTTLLVVINALRLLGFRAA